MKDGEFVDDIFGRLHVLLKKSRSSRTDILKGLDKLEVVGQLSLGMGTKDHNHPRSKRSEKIWHGMSSWESMESTFKIGSIYKRRILLPSNLKRQASKKKKKKSLTKALKVQMQEYDGSNNSNGFMNDEVALMSRKFK